jgi:hypothetical protein
MESCLRHLQKHCKTIINIRFVRRVT